MRNFKHSFFSGEGHSPSPDPTPLGRGTPSPDPPPRGLRPLATPPPLQRFCIHHYVRQTSNRDTSDSIIA